jgi:glycosyltransferase involved in cell wall biosynthesis
LAALDGNLVAGVTILPERFAPIVFSPFRQEVIESLSWLNRTNLAGKISLQSISWLSEALRHSDAEFIGIGKSMDYPDLVQLRDAFDRGFPLTCIVHSAFFPSSMLTMQNSVIFSRPYDAWVVTSTAARSATSCLLAQAKERLAQVLPRLHVGDFPEPQLRLIPLGISDEFCEPIEKARARRELGIPEAATVVLYVGRLSSDYKANLELLLDTARSLADDIPSLYLVLAGSTFHGNDVQSAVSADGSEIPRRLLVIRDFPRYLKKYIYYAADVFVSPVDNIQESFGLTILEAMAAGLPVIASNWSGYRDIVVEGETGFLIDTMIDSQVWDTADKLAAFALSPITESYLARHTLVSPQQLIQRLRLLLTDSALRARFGMAGRSRILNTYVWSMVIRQYAELWQEQLAVYRETGAATPSRLRLRPAFEQYSSVYGNPQLLIVRSTKAAVTMFRERFPSEPEVGMLLERCAEHPLIVSQLHSPGSEVGLVLRLAKSGYVQIMGYTESGTTNS